MTNQPTVINWPPQLVLSANHVAYQLTSISTNWTYNDRCRPLSATVVLWWHHRCTLIEPSNLHSVQQRFGASERSFIYFVFTEPILNQHMPHRYDQPHSSHFAKKYLVLFQNLCNQSLQRRWTLKIVFFKNGNPNIINCWLQLGMVPVVVHH